MNKLKRILCICSLSTFSLPAIGVEISWIDFFLWNTGSLSQNNLAASNGLTLNASFSGVSNMGAGSPWGDSFLVNDPAWPFSNNVIPYVGVQSSGSTTLTTTLTLDFTSTGGLPSGGSIGIADLEDPSSSVTLTGLSGGSTVSVDWAIAFYQTLGVQSPPPAWNPASSTLRGNIPISQAPDTVNNFAFLVTNIPLDSVSLQITTVSGDGVAFSASSETVPPKSIPAPSVILLLCWAVPGFWVSHTLRDQLSSQRKLV